MKDGPLMARPGFVSLIPGAQQVFPHDPIGDRAREQRVRRDYHRLGVKLTRRIPKEEVNA